MECDCYLRNVQDFLADGKTPCERRFGEPFKWPIIPFGAMDEYLPISIRDPSRLHQFGKKVLPKLPGNALIVVVNLSCKRSALTIIGMSMRTEVRQIRGLVSQKIFYWKRNLPRDRCGPGETDKSSDDYETRSCVVWSVDKSQQCPAKN